MVSKFVYRKDNMRGTKPKRVITSTTRYRTNGRNITGSLTRTYVGSGRTQKKG